LGSSSPIGTEDKLLVAVMFSARDNEQPGKEGIHLPVRKAPKAQTRFSPNE